MAAARRKGRTGLQASRQGLLIYVPSSSFFSTLAREKKEKLLLIGRRPRTPSEFLSREDRQHRHPPIPCPSWRTPGRRCAAVPEMSGVWTARITKKKNTLAARRADRTEKKHHLAVASLLRHRWRTGSWTETKQYKRRTSLVAPQLAQKSRCSPLHHVVPAVTADEPCNCIHDGHLFAGGTRCARSSFLPRMCVCLSVG